MPNIPDNATIEQLIAWMEQHSDLWNASPTTIGLTPAQATAYKDKVNGARAAFEQAQVARLASKQATVGQNEALRTARRLAGDAVNTIKAFIEQSGNTSLWETAGLEPPAPRGTTPPPNAPFDLTAGLDGEGNLNLKWKASQPRGVTGVVYIVKRALNNASTFTQVDIVGEKRFTDGTVPQGTTSVSYVLIARRGGDQSQPSSILSVRFGRAPGGGLTIVNETFDGKPVNLAA